MDFAQSWLDYKKENNTDRIYFSNEKRDCLVVIAEGNGDNLTRDDREDGYVDYWYIEVYKAPLDSRTSYNLDGGFTMLTEYIDHINPSLQDVIDLAFSEYSSIHDLGEITPISEEEGEELEQDFEQKEMTRIQHIPPTACRMFPARQKIIIKEDNEEERV